MVKINTVPGTPAATNMGAWASWKARLVSEKNDRLATLPQNSAPERSRRIGSVVHLNESYITSHLRVFAREARINDPDCIRSIGSRDRACVNV